MRRFLRKPLLYSRQRRFLVDPQLFFELYGRKPDSTDEPTVSANSAGDDHSLPSESSPMGIHALGEFFSHLYATPNESLNRSVVVNALEALNTSLSLPLNRRARFSEQHCIYARDVWKYGERYDFHIAALYVSVLYYGGKYDEVIQYVEKHWSSETISKVASSSTLDVKDTCHALRLFTVYVLSCSKSKNHLNTFIISRVKEVAEGSIRILKSSTSTETVREYTLLLYSLDWYFVHTDYVNEREVLSSIFIPLLPKKLTPYLFITSSDISDDVRKGLTPSILFQNGKRHAKDGDKEGIQRLFRDCQRREEKNEGFRLFLLSPQLGELMSQISGMDDRVMSEVVTFCGTSLSCEALSKIGLKERSRSKVLQVLGNMKGPEAYFAARQVLFHQNIEESLVFQQKYGDILSGDPQLEWQTALKSMKESLASGDMKWRNKLPTVLRLLSDAGETGKFFNLLRESHSEGENGSLMIASALAQTVRRSERWWHALEVLDVIATCEHPRTVEDDLFLKDACLQTMYALRDAKRWKEALHFYNSLVPVMPESAHRVLCSVVCGMPASSPWQEALSTVQKYGEVPEKFLTTLLCARNPDQVDISQQVNPRSWRYILQGYADGGHWKHALQFIKKMKHVDFNAWVSVLRAAQRAPFGSLSSNIFESLDENVWNNTALLRLTVLVAEGHGYWKELYKNMEKYKNNSSTSEYHALVGFFIDGTLPSTEMVFTDEYVIHRLLMFPIPFVKSLSINILWTRKTRDIFNNTYQKDMKAFIQNHYKVHLSCLPKKKKNQYDTQINVFTLSSIAPQAPLTGNNTLVTVLDHLIVAYKPPGILSHSFARSVAQKGQVGTMYSLAYLLPPSSCGLIALIDSSIPTKSIHLVMKVLLRLCAVDAVSLPLLSTEFFVLYTMEVLEGPSSDGCIAVMATCCSDQDGLLAGSLYLLQESIVSEGWRIIGSDEEKGKNSTVNGDSIHLAELCVFIQNTNIEGFPMHFTISRPPSWIKLLPEE
ncbi:uncharacterized protein TM35_000012920 [Trypanosoma theileri]|uniref:Uncharacterized protein n=1 Tax=Trypanosoma theileri TaxID=67003 RepID=A0A1X0P9B3_9TRYP|nr:uncharacterized protein TM35_000012920 [Trypanosoma theileri]ORC93415.1 hypothetical protein TM35_000012920 [Trypanosoma theileri]